MRNSLVFPPLTREVQLDEKSAFVGKKEARCDPDNPADRDLGDRWDHTAVDPEHALLIAMVPGKRQQQNCREVLEQVKARTDGRTDLLLTSDEYASYEPAIKAAYGVETPVPRKPGPGRPPKPRKVVPEDLCYATVRKTRKKGRVVEVIQKVVFGVAALLTALLDRSPVSSTINTSFVERNNGTDRGQNARKGRRTYCFSKRVDVHDAVSFFVGFSYNFCWPVRTLQRRLATEGPCTPAMAARLTDHVWPVGEWATYAAKPG
ncbi:hypothetical protein ACFL59_11675 [Planctomycetota bacterium]